MTLEQIPTDIGMKVKDPDVGLTLIENLFLESDALLANKWNTGNPEDREQCNQFAKSHTFFHKENPGRMTVTVHCTYLTISQRSSNVSTEYKVKKNIDIVIVALSDFAAGLVYEPMPYDYFSDGGGSSAKRQTHCD